MILFCGDIHGEFKTLKYNLKRFGISDADVFLCGDIGMGFHKPKYYENTLHHISKYLKEHNIFVYAIRGNHDDPSYFDNRKYGQFQMLEDYSIVESHGKRIMGIGGAISVDRKHRTENIDYWVDEPVVKDLSKLDNVDVDVVFSHTSPNFVYPLRAKSDDPDLTEELTKERADMAEIYENLDISHWFYGHFHHSETTKFNDTIFTCLNIDEIKEL